MKYVALLRGIGPSNPNMHGAKLKEALESLGLKNVVPVISSGNVVFESGSSNAAALEKKIEAVWPKKLGFTSMTIVQSQADLEKLEKLDPFKGVEKSRDNYTVVTFFKDGKKPMCTVIDMSKSRTPDFMRDLEKKYGKAVTTRTWLTVGRILKKMREA